MGLAPGDSADRREMSWRVTCASVVLLLTACTRSDIQNKIEKAEVAVKDQLKDPNSAEFRNVAVYGIHVCGEVNAKNSFDGYTGYGRFMVIVADTANNPIVLGIEHDGTGLIEAMWKNCKPDTKPSN